MADRHRVRLDRLISENRHQEAYRLTSDIAEFYQKHDLELPYEFHSWCGELQRESLGRRKNQEENHPKENQ